MVNAADKLHKPGVLKSMTDGLETMHEQVWRKYIEDRKEKVCRLSVSACWLAT